MAFLPRQLGGTGSINDLPMGDISMIMCDMSLARHLLSCVAPWILACFPIELHHGLVECDYGELKSPPRVCLESYLQLSWDFQI